MGNAAAVQGVAESSRRRLLLQQYNRQPHVLVSHSLVKALEQRRLQILQPSSGSTTTQPVSSKHPQWSLPLREIHDVLLCEFGVQCTLGELPIVLRHLGCQLVMPDSESSSGEEWYSVQEMATYIAPRRVLRQVKRPLECPNSVKFSHNNLTIWQAAKMGDLDVLQAVCKAHNEAYRALDDFENSPLYYASLCGREVAVDFVLKAYERDNRTIAPDELMRCVTNALNQNIRALLQQKMTLEEVLQAKEQESECGEEDDDDETGGVWFGLLDDEE